MSTNNKLTEYINSLRIQAKELDNDKYLLAMADSIEKNEKVLSTTVEIAVATRVQAYKANTLMSERIAQLTELVNGLISYQQDCTDLSVAAFGLQAPKEEQKEASVKTEEEESYVPQEIESSQSDDVKRAQIAQEKEEISLKPEPELKDSPAEEDTLPYEEVDAPPAPTKKRKTGKVPEFTPPD